MKTTYTFVVDEQQKIIMTYNTPEGNEGGEETYQYRLVTEKMPIPTRNVVISTYEFHWMLEQCIRNGYKLE